ncbi:MAG: phosphate butyryltransferase [Lachnospiraceae bacterium]|jgi:phosphate butyryltransferase|nr:phosphate butyryltransferase [Lachnospiraceae bacterium]
MKRTFAELIAKLNDIPMKKVAVACAQDQAALEAIKTAKERGIADAILVGDREKIKIAADPLGIDLDDFEILDISDDYEAALKAVELVHNRAADMYMKGHIDTRGFLKSVLDRDIGLRTGSPLSHVCVFEIEGIDQLLFLTDVAFIPYPSLEEKVSIIRNTLVITGACGIINPKVAPLAAVEVVNPKMPPTMDAAELTRMYREGEITGCIIDGPLSLDLAINREAAAMKGATDRDIQGDADVLLFPNIDAGNLVYKTLVNTAKVHNGNILTGTNAPVILTSRSDDCESKVNSIALGAVVADAMRQ